MAQKLFFIVNPVSRNGKTGKRWPVFREQLEKEGLVFDYALTKQAGHAQELAFEAKNAGYSTICAVGGDGTLNEVANGLYLPLANPYQGRLALFSQGTGGDFIRTIKGPQEIKVIADMLKGESYQFIDLGLAEIVTKELTTKRIFVNVADLGIGAESAYHVNRTSKVLGGFLSFVMGTLKAIFVFKNPLVEFSIDDGPWQAERVCCLVVANGRYFGGGMQVAPQALLDSGYLNVVVVGDLSKGKFIKNLHRVYSGKHLQLKEVSTYQAQKVIVKSLDAVKIELDGEHPDPGTVTFSVLPQKAKFAVLETKEK